MVSDLGAGAARSGGTAKNPKSLVGFVLAGIGVEAQLRLIETKSASANSWKRRRSTIAVAERSKQEPPRPARRRQPPTIELSQAGNDPTFTVEITIQRGESRLEGLYRKTQ